MRLEQKRLDKLAASALRRANREPRAPRGKAEDAPISNCRDIEFGSEPHLFNQLFNQFIIIFLDLTYVFNQMEIMLVLVLLNQIQN